MKEALPGLRAAVDAARRGVCFEGESTLPLARIHDHHLSWAQWFADSRVPGVLRARWFEQRHMLHHTRRWNRDHSEELRSAWLNGVGMLVWENVFGSWVGWNDRDRAKLRAMTVLQRRHADLLATGEWTPLAAHGGGSPPAVVASRWTDGETTLWAVANTGAEPFAGELIGAGLEVAVPAGGIAAVVDGEQVMAAPAGESGAFPARLPDRVPAPIALAAEVPLRLRRGARTAAVDQLRVPPPRDRDLRRGAVRRGVEAAPAAASRLRRGDAEARRGSALRDRCPRGDER